MSAPEEHRSPADVEPDSPFLDREEERRLVERAQDGDRRAKGRLFKAHEQWIWSLVHRWNVPESDKGDLFGAASLAWMEALEKFDPSRGTRLVTWAAYRVWPAIRREHANLLDLPEKLEEVPLNASPEPQEDGHGVGESAQAEARHQRADPRRADDDLLREDLAGALEDALDPRGPLRPQERTAVRLYYGLDGRDRPLDQEEVGLELGVSQRYVSTLLEKAHLTLRDKFPNLRDYLAPPDR